jgi:Ran GTPase-activating protein (RanGAP) involved in mRNA processing and transport
MVLNSSPIKRNYSIQKIDLGGNNIGDKGAKCIAEAIQNNSTLDKIDLESNCIKEEGAKDLSEAI